MIAGGLLSTIARVRGERRLLIALLAVSVGQSLALLVPAWAVQHMFDRALLATGQSIALAKPMAAFVAATLMVIGIEVIRRRLAAELAIRHAAQMRTSLFRRRLEGDLPTPSTGMLLLPFVGDLTAARRWVSEGMARAVSALVLLPLVLIVLATRSLVLASAVAGALGLALLVSYLFVPPLEKAVRTMRQRRGSLTSFLTGRLLAAEVVRASGRIEREIRKAERRTATLSDAERRRAWALGGTRGAARFSSGVILLATLLAGVHEVAARHLTPGEVAATLTLVALLSQAVDDLVRSIEMWKPAQVAYERFDRVDRAASPSRKTRRKPSTDAGLEIVDLHVPGIAKAVSATIAPGAIVLVDGATAAGKSALLQALAMPHQRSGLVALDGRDLARANERRRAKLIGYAHSGSSVVPGSLRLNLDYRDSGLHDDALLALARRYGLARLVARLPGGFGGRLREDAQLSSSERGSVSLVRALAGDPGLLILDDIDTELDPALVNLLAEDLKARSGVTLIVAQRPEIRALANQRWQIEDGRVTVATIDEADARVIPITRRKR